MKRSKFDYISSLLMKEGENCFSNVSDMLLNETVSYNEAEAFLYSVNKEVRFLLFLEIYSAVLDNDLNLASRVFREAYCASNNIYNQIRLSRFEFNLKDFIKQLKKERVDIMDQKEKNVLKELSNSDPISVFRGMNLAEKESGNFGISWSLYKEKAEKYLYLKANNVRNGVLVERKILKKDIIAVWLVAEDDDVEIILL